MEKKFLFLGFLLIVLSVNSFSQSYLNINWDDKTVDLETSDHDLQGIFSNHYVEYFNSKFSDEVYIYETHHMKTKINKITDDSNNDIFISKINVSEIVDVKSKIINDDTTATYGFEEMKKMIDKSTSSENYNYYKIPGIKEQNIRIEASSGLTEQEIEKMKKDAEANAEADAKAKETVDKLNSADAMIFQTEKQLKEFGDKLSDDKKKPIEEALEELKKSYESKDLEKIDPALEKINEAWKAASEEMYKAQQNQQGGQAEQSADNNSNESSDNVEDVDFEEVKE